jgi:signal transduction histidine kinase
MTTILKISKGAAGREEALGALREAGIGVVEVADWEAASEALRNCDAALVVCDGEVLDSRTWPRSRRPSTRSAAGKKTMAVAPDVARALSHELRTPLSAMAGWLHLMESGKLDPEGMKRAVGKLRGNIEEQGAHHRSLSGNFEYRKELMRI